MTKSPRIADISVKHGILTRISSPFSFGFTTTLGVLVALLLAMALSDLSTVLIYILLAMFAALGLNPAVESLTHKGVKRGWAIVIVFFVFALVLGGVLAFIIPTVITQVAQFVKDAPRLVDEAQKSDWFLWIQDRFGDGVNDAIDHVTSFVTDPANLATLGGGALQVGASVISGVSGTVITIVLTLYFLSSLSSIKEGFYRLTPARGRENLAKITDKITASIGGYLIGMVILAACNAAVAFVLHLVLKLPFPALMAVLAFGITLIPMIGSVLYWGIASIAALFTGPVAAIIFAVAYLVYMQIEAYVLTPRVMNRTIEIPGALVVIGALVGGTLLGLIGALVAIPITASLLLIIKQVWVPRQDAKVEPLPRFSGE